MVRVKLILLLQKNNPSLLDFCYSDVLKTWQQSTPKLGNLKYVNNNCKSEPGRWEIQDGHLVFPGSLTNLIFILWVKTFPGYRVNALTMTKKIIFHLIFSEILLVKVCIYYDSLLR